MEPELSMPDTIVGKFYRELRCPKCRKLICEEYIYQGRVKFTCYRCDEITEFNFSSDYKKMKSR